MVHGTQACAIAEVRDDDTTIRMRAQVLRQSAGDVFVRQAMETVALDAAGGEFAWQRKVLRERVLGTMKRGVEARDLRQSRMQCHQRADRRQVVRLM